MGRFPRIVALSLLFALPSFPGCRRAPSRMPPEQSRTYPVTGIVRSIDSADRTVTIEHAEIPGFMPAMTMPFDVKSFAEAELLQAGEPVRFRLVVTETSSWIEGIAKIDRSEVPLPEAPAPAQGQTEGARLRAGDRLPNFKLTDSKGREVTPTTFSGQPLLLTFIYTRCPLPNFCPLVSRNLQEISEAVGADAALHLLSVSIDPEHDTPEVLAQYATGYTSDQDRWRFARGTPEETQRLTGAFAVGMRAEGGTINHTLTTALIAADGTVQQIWRGNAWKPADVVAALRRRPGRTD